MKRFCQTTEILIYDVLVTVETNRIYIKFILKFCNNRFYTMRNQWSGNKQSNNEIKNETNQIMSFEKIGKINNCQIMTRHFLLLFQVAVAVKTLKTGSSLEEKLDFLGEADMMKRFDHRNIVKLLGVCTRNEPVYTVMEFMLYGDLKTYLLARWDQ